MAAVVAAAAPSVGTAAAQMVPAQDAASLLGGERAQGAVIWSHGRSLQQECALAPTPEYIHPALPIGYPHSFFYIQTLSRNSIVQ